MTPVALMTVRILGTDSASSRATIAAAIVSSGAGWVPAAARSRGASPAHRAAAAIASCGWRLRASTTAGWSSSLATDGRLRNGFEVMRAARGAAPRSLSLAPPGVQHPDDLVRPVPALDHSLLEGRVPLRHPGFAPVLGQGGNDEPEGTAAEGEGDGQDRDEVPGEGFFDGHDSPPGTAGTVAPDTQPTGLASSPASLPDLGVLLFGPTRPSVDHPGDLVGGVPALDHLPLQARVGLIDLRLPQVARDDGDAPEDHGQAEDAADGDDGDEGFFGHGIPHGYVGQTSDGYSSLPCRDFGLRAQFSQKNSPPANPDRLPGLLPGCTIGRGNQNRNWDWF